VEGIYLGVLGWSDVCVAIWVGVGYHIICYERKCTGE
jgi:hypothetical protein